ncbi:MAG: hypothetical protein U0835_05995 [Isosphaeraceae bacterium]
MSRKNQVKRRREGGNSQESPEQGREHESGGWSEGQESAGRFSYGDQQDDGGRRGGQGVLGSAQVFARYPLATVLASFGAGFTVGVLVTAALTREKKGWLERHGVYDSLSDVSSQLRRIPGKLAEHLPDSLTRR